MQNIDELPEEIITEILSFVPTESLIQTTSLLSHKWFELSGNTKLLEYRCEVDNFSNFCKTNIHKQISVFKKHNENIIKPLSSHLKRQYYHLKFLKKEMKFETDFHNIINISEDGRLMTIKYNNDTEDLPYDSDDDDDKITSCPTSFNPALDIFYFEVLCKYVRKPSSFAIGFATNVRRLKFAQLGWELGSIGYHGDDGQVYIPTLAEGVIQFEKFKKGDIVGCGVFQGKIFFTKNGKFQGYVASRKVLQQLYPSISTWRSGEYEINFGQEEFKFDLEKIEQSKDELEVLYDSDDEIDDNDDDYLTDSDYVSEDEEEEE